MRIAQRTAPSRLVWALALLLLLTAVAGPLISPHDPFDQSAHNRLSPPDLAYVLGRDAFGRDIFSRLVYAARITLAVGLGSVALAGSLGTLLGLFAGYAGRRVEGALMRAVDILMSFPSLLLGVLVLAVLGTGVDKLIVAVGLVLAAPFARMVHAATLSLKQREFVEAARSIGAGPGRILSYHLLPNVATEIIVLAGIQAASAIRIEASLSFIGLGVSPPTPSWGNMLRDAVPVLLTAPWLAVAPGVAVAATVLTFNLIADGLRDHFDPR